MKLRIKAISMLIFLLCFGSLPVITMAQSYEIDAYNGQTVTTCSGTFYDSGGSGGNYANNENYSMTFCSASGQYLAFDFSMSSSALNLDAGTGDTLYFYNGTTAGGTPIAFLTSSDDVAFTQLMINTLSTCVTVVWHSNGTAVDGGWAANISCQNPPSCAGNPPAADLFGQATFICNLNNYCGTTASYYGEDLPYNLGGGGTCPTPDDGIFGGTIENNSWLAFQAVATTASFEFTVTNCSGDGIQVGIFGFNGSVFNLVSPCALTDGSQGGTFTVTASSLTVGNTYYIMIDGNAGANCDYVIHANTGVAVVNAGPDQTLCTTSATMAANTPSSGTGTWSTIAGTGTFAGINNPVSAVSGLSNGTNTFVWTIPSGPCQNVSDTVSIFVTAGTSATISYAGPFCLSNATPQPVNLSGTTGGTFSASPSGLSINTTSGAITPSTSTAGTYTVTYNVSGACGPATTTVVISNTATPSFSINNSLCSGSTAPLLPAVSTNGISGAWSPAVVSNTATGTYTFTPAAGQCAVSASVTVTVQPGTAPAFTSSSTNVTCAGLNTGSITLNPTAGTPTYQWVSGPVVSPIPAANLPSGATDERALINLPAGTYCVNVTGSSSTTTTVNLFSETFESGSGGWTLDNSTGTNIWVLNNNYTGGTCMVGATPFSCPNIPNQPAAVTGYPQSNYLHIKATTTVPVVCGSGSSSPFPPLNANFNGSDGAADQKATLNTPINTTGLTNVVFSFYWMGDGDAYDYGALEYSLNGGTTWTQAGAKLNNQTSWVLATRTDPTWAGQSNLRFRFRWINNASSSQDPPVCIDQITITGDQSSTCASTVQQCFTITSPSLVTPTFNAVAPVCQGAAAPVLPTSSTNTPAISGSWSPAVSTLTPGTTTYTFTPNAGQCANMATMNITVNATPAITPLASPPSVCPGQSSTLSASGASSYTWNPGNLSGSSVTVTPSSNTTYTVTGTSAAGCTATAGTTVSISPNALINAAASPAAICQGQTVSLSATGASTYTWNPGSLSGSSLTVSPSGSTTYTVTGTTSSGCTGSTTVSVTVNPNPAITASASPTVICNGQSATLSASGANSYTWSPGSLSGTTVTVSPAVNTTYTVTGTSSSGCSGTAGILITVNPNPAVNITASPASVCTGQSTTLTASGAANYTWNPGGQQGTSITITPAMTTTYSVTGTSAAGCNGTGTVAVTVNALPTVNANTSSSAVCSGQSVVLSATGASTYSWNPGSLSGSSITVIPSGSTTYTVTGTTSAGCTGSTTVSVTINPNPSITASASPTVICNGQSTTLSASGANSYTWSPGSLTGTTVTVSPSVNTTYTVTGTSSSGCSGTAGILITVNANPALNITASPASVCAGQSTTLTASGAANYTWNPGGQQGTSITITPAMTTTYSVTGTSAAGCNGTGTLNITVHPVPTVNATASPAAICAGAASTLTASGADSYLWSPGSLTGSQCAVHPLTSTTYTVTGTSIAGCTGSNTVTVSVTPLPLVTAGAAPASLCAGGTTTLVASGAQSYLWSNGAGSDSSVNVQPLSSTTYTVTGTSSGCSNTAAVAITVFPIPTILVSASPASVCAGSATTLTADGASDYDWAPSPDLSSTTGNTVIAHPINNTQYTVTGNSNGCTASESIAIGVYSNLNVTVNPSSDTICKGNSTVLTAQGATNYTWSPANGLSVISGNPVTAAPLVTTTYTVTGTDASGCSGSASAVVVLFENVDLSFLTLPAEGCAPLPVSFEYIPDGKADTNTLHWDFGDPESNADQSGSTHAGYVYTNSGAFNVTLTAQSIYGCPVSGHQTIRVFAQPVADFIFRPLVSETNNPLVDFYDESDNASSWLWDFGDPESWSENNSLLQNPSHFYADSGRYTVQLVVTNSNQCSDTVEKNIHVIESYVFFMPNAFSPNGDGRNDIFLGQGMGIAEDGFDMYVYDRWGGELFHSEHPETGWDGRSEGSDEIVAQGIYVWIIWVKDKLNIEHKLTGTVMLYR